MKLLNKIQYGDRYTEYILEQWKTAVEMSNALSDRRTNMNNIYVSINAIMIALLTFQFEKKSIGFAIVGISVCVLWLVNLNNYKRLNSVKFQIINELEKKLPANVFDYEWELVGRGDESKKYKKMSCIEMIIPGIFILVYAVNIFYPVVFKQ